MVFCTNYVDDLQSQSLQYKMYLYFVFLVREVMGCWEYVFVVEGYFENAYICGMFWLDPIFNQFWFTMWHGEPHFKVAKQSHIL